MGYRDEEEALRARLSLVEDDLHKALQRERQFRVASDELSKAIKDMRPPASVRWYTLVERAGRFIAETWKITAWGTTICGGVLLLGLMITRESQVDQFERGRAAGLASFECPACPDAPVTPLGEQCTNVCSALGMRQIAHFDHGNMYTCTCAGRGSFCNFASPHEGPGASAAQLDCSPLPGEM